MFAAVRSIGVLACALANATGVSAGLGTVLPQGGAGGIDGIGVQEEGEINQQWLSFDPNKDTSVASQLFALENALDPEHDDQMRRNLEVLQPTSESSSRIFKLACSIFDYELNRTPFPSGEQFQLLVEIVKEVNNAAIGVAGTVCDVLKAINDLIVKPFQLVINTIFDSLKTVITAEKGNVTDICDKLIGSSKSISDAPTASPTEPPTLSPITLSPTQNPSLQPTDSLQPKVVYTNSTLAKETFKYDNLIELPLGEDFLFMRDDEIVGLLLQSEAREMLAEYIESVTGKSQADLTPQELERLEGFFGDIFKSIVKEMPINVMKNIAKTFCGVGLTAIIDVRDTALKALGAEELKPLIEQAIIRLQSGFLEFADTFSNTVHLLCNATCPNSFISEAKNLSTAIQGTIQNFTRYGPTDDTIYYGRKAVCDPITRSFRTVKMIQTNINYFVTSISTFSKAAPECGGGIETLGLGAICSVVSSVITEVSYVGNLIADNSKKIADTYASMQNASLYTDMCSCFARDNKLLKGSGCDVIDQNCDGVIDDCDEDQTPPEISLVQPIPTIPFPSFEDAEAFLTENIQVSDDCAQDLTKTIEIIKEEGRNNLEFQVTVFHPRCDQTFIYENSNSELATTATTTGSSSPGQPPIFQMRVAIDEEAPTVSSGWYIPQNPSFDDEFAFLPHSSKSRKTSSSSKCYKSRSEKSLSVDDGMDLPPSIDSIYQDPLSLSLSLSLEPLREFGGRAAPSPSFDYYKRPSRSSSRSSKSRKLSRLRYPRGGEILAVDSKFFNTKFVDINFWYQLDDDNEDGTLDVSVEVQSNQLTEDERRMARIYLLKTGTLTKVGVNLALER